MQCIYRGKNSLKALATSKMMLGKHLLAPIRGFSCKTLNSFMHISTLGHLGICQSQTLLRVNQHLRTRFLEYLEINPRSTLVLELLGLHP
jgi:hypothetical protein